MKSLTSPQIDTQKRTIAFFIRNDDAAHVSVAGASQISVAGSFNNWQQDLLYMQPIQDGVWKVEISLLPRGKYHYKFCIDNTMWMEDVDNPAKVPDGKKGFDSVFTV